MVSLRSSYSHRTPVKVCAVRQRPPFPRSFPRFPQRYRRIHHRRGRERYRRRPSVSWGCYGATGAASVCFLVAGPVSLCLSRTRFGNSELSARAPIGSVASALLPPVMASSPAGSTTLLRRVCIPASRVLLASTGAYSACLALQYGANNNPVYDKVEKSRVWIPFSRSCTTLRMSSDMYSDFSAVPKSRRLPPAQV